MTKDALIILASAVALALVCGGLEVFVGDHDPGAVFPWSFMAIVFAICGGIAGALGSVAFLLLRWVVKFVL